MQIQSISTPSAPTPVSTATVQTPAATGQGGASAGDSVTLSPAALALLNKGAPAPDPSAGVWASDTVARAMAALTDTGDGTPVGERIDAFRTMTAVIADAGNFETAAQRDAAAGITTAFLDSPYARHLQDVFTGIQRTVRQTDVYLTPESLENTLGAFDTLSSDDQQTFLAAANLFYELAGSPRGPGGEAFASADAYRANLTAQIGIARELSTALADPGYAQAVQAELTRTPRAGETVSDSHHRRLETLGAAAEAAGDQRTVDLVRLATAPSNHDSWTADAEAHFATYGPPPAIAPSTGPLIPYWPQQTNDAPPSNTELAKALSVINDRSGATTLQEQAKAYGTLNLYLWHSAETGPLLLAMHKNVEKSGIYPKLWAAEQRFADTKLGYVSEMDRRAEAGEELMDEEFTLRALNRLSASDQEFYFAMSGSKTVYSDSHPSGQVVRFSSLEAFKADLLRTIEEATPIYDRVRRAKKAARAEAGNRPMSDEQFTLNWMNKLSQEDQEFVFHRQANGMHAVGGQNGQPFEIQHYASLADYKADLKRKAGAQARQAAAKETKAAPAKPNAAPPTVKLPEMTTTAPSSLNATIALQVLTRMVEASRAPSSAPHAWGRTAGRSPP